MNIASLLGIRVPVILASQSPRRRQLLAQIGLECSVIPSQVDEDALHNPSLHPSDYVMHLALHKAKDVANLTAGDALIIGADTTVVLQGDILNKPRNAGEAYAMLERLSGNTHTVYTGIALVCGGKELTSCSTANVRFRTLGDREIRAYIATGSPMDKAGAYGIQDDFGAVFVEHIEGDYYTIVGLPLALLYTSIIQILGGGMDAHPPH
ncbi:MAG: septum formation protein Maf [Candidatus Kapabacteria bacterium]|nr:septum formation protein Maf [Candidatus Kapabacteria bacterium]